MAQSGERVGQRVFDIKLQGDLMQESFDGIEAAGERNKAVIKEFIGINVENVLTLELVPKAQDPAIEQVPIINFIEVIREDD